MRRALSVQNFPENSRLRGRHQLKEYRYGMHTACRYHTCRTNLRTAKPGCLSVLKKAAKEKYDGGAIKKNCQDWADREGVESAFGNAACRLFTVPAPNYTSIPVKDSSTEACSGKGSPWTSDTPSCGDTNCCCMTKHCVRKELRRYRNAQRANCKVLTRSDDGMNEACS